MTHSGARAGGRCRALEGVAICGLNRLVEVGDNIADVLDANREPDQFGRDAGISLFFHGELLVGGRGRVNDERFGVADVGQ